MNKLVYKLIVVFLAVGLVVSCDKEDFVEYPQGGNQAINDAYLQIQTPVVPFQAGIESYNIEVNVLNGTKRINSVNMYSQFTDAASQAQSNKILFGTYDVNELKTVVTDNFTYADLKEGLTVNGGSLPDSDTELAIGSGWVLSFEGNLADGGTIPINGVINVGVLSPYAGLYRVIESAYFRIGVESSLTDWTQQQRFIGSVNETTFSYNDFWGPFGWTGGSFNFEVAEDNTITVPLLVDGSLFSGNRALRCDTEPELFVNVPCSGSNELVKDPDNPDGSNGKHLIKITYGYFTDGSGPREFYEVLEKIVD